MKLYIKKSVIGFLFLLIFLLFSAPSFALALELDYPTIPTPIGPLDLDTITDEGGFTVAGLIVFIYGAAIWIAGILAFISLVYVGFVYILSGSGMVGRGKALRRLKNVLWGLVILLFVTALLNVVNPEILNLEDSLVVAVAPNDKTYQEVEFEGFKFEGFFVDNGSGGGGTGDGEEPVISCQEQCLAKCGGMPACETECFKLPPCPELACPVLRVTSSFTAYCYDRGSARHNGHDVMANEGTPIYAMEAGTLDRVGWIDSGGCRLWIIGTQSGRAYAHLHMGTTLDCSDAFGSGIREGATVVAGQTLGYVGTTYNGRADGTVAHLHLTIVKPSGSEECSPPPLSGNYGGPTMDGAPLFKQAGCPFT
ncbi:MAG: peptidoglycan DD-metalloendopeptidase family protein [Candidatus Spechtbacterales bacterium]